jgi:hypothetical protein
MKYLFLLLISFNAMAADADSNFYSLCKTTLENNPKALPVCETVYQKFFVKNNKSDIVNIRPSDVGAPDSPIDSKVQYFIFNDPNFVSGMAYCYFVYRNWISPTTVSPDALAMSASGFSILNEEIPAYQKWLISASEGKKCKATVEKEAEVSVANLETALKGKVALIGLNPYSLINSPEVTSDSILKEMTLTVNHERIHAYQVACPEFEKWSIKEWEKLPFATKNAYIKKYPSYTWSIPRVAGREYIAFLFENAPANVAEHITKCKF